MIFIFQNEDFAGWIKPVDFIGMCNPPTFWESAECPDQGCNGQGTIDEQRGLFAQRHILLSPVKGLPWVTGLVFFYTERLYSSQDLMAGNFISGGRW
jgi:hypothetical protein